MKILIIQQKMIGDVLTSSILFEAIKRQYPHYKLHYLINAHAYAVVEGNPFIDKFIFVTPEIERSKSKFFTFLKDIKAEHYDTVIDVYGKWSSNMICYASQAKIKIGYYKWYTSYFYHTAIQRKKAPTGPIGLAYEHRMQLLKPLKIETKQIVKPKIYLNEDELTTAKIYLESMLVDLSQPVIMINVLGSSANKTYPFSYMAEVIDRIIEYSKAQILFNYIPNQREDALAILKLCKTENQDYIKFNIVPKGLRAFLAVTHFCKVLIGNEGGAINMAKGLNIPTFSIFSPWIDKKSWAMFEDKNNISIHLKDVKPQFYTNTQEKALKPKATELYKALTPSLFTLKLEQFLNHLKLY